MGTGVSALNSVETAGTEANADGDTVGDVCDDTPFPPDADGDGLTDSHICICRPCNMNRKEVRFLAQLAVAAELALAKAQGEDSVFRISSEDAYQVLTNRETLEMVLQQGLKEEHMQYKDRIIDLLTSMKDRIKVEDLTVY